MRATLAVAFVDAVGIGVGAAVLGVPLALPLGVLVFLGSFVPIVGATVTGLVAVLVALVAKGPVTALLLLGVVLLVQQVEGHVLQPLLLGRAVKVHPLAVVLAIATGVLLAGIVGALVAVPIVAVANTVALLPDAGRQPGAGRTGDRRHGRPHGLTPRPGQRQRTAARTPRRGGWPWRAPPRFRPGRPSTCGVAPSSTTGPRDARRRPPGPRSRTRERCS